MPSAFRTGYGDQLQPACADSTSRSDRIETPTSAACSYFATSSEQLSTPVVQAVASDDSSAAVRFGGTPRTPLRSTHHRLGFAALGSSWVSVQPLSGFQFFAENFDFRWSINTESAFARTRMNHRDCDIGYILDPDDDLFPVASCYDQHWNRLQLVVRKELTAAFERQPIRLRFALMGSSASLRCRRCVQRSATQFVAVAASMDSSESVPAFQGRLLRRSRDLKGTGRPVRGAFRHQA